MMRFSLILLLISGLGFFQGLASSAKLLYPAPDTSESDLFFTVNSPPLDLKIALNNDGNGIAASTRPAQQPRDKNRGIDALVSGLRWYTLLEGSIPEQSVFFHKYFRKSITPTVLRL